MSFHLGGHIPITTCTETRHPSEKEILRLSKIDQFYNIFILTNFSQDNIGRFNVPVDNSHFPQIANSKYKLNCDIDLDFGC